MKGPKNFKEKLNGYTLDTLGGSYYLTATTNNRLYITRSLRDANVILLVFHWEENLYDIEVVTRTGEPIKSARSIYGMYLHPNSVKEFDTFLSSVRSLASYYSHLFED